MKVNIPLPKTGKIDCSYSYLYVAAIPEDMKITYFCLPRNSFQMELLGYEIVKCMINSQDIQTILALFCPYNITAPVILAPLLHWSFLLPYLQQGDCGPEDFSLL